MSFQNCQAIGFSLYRAITSRSELNPLQLQILHLDFVEREREREQSNNEMAQLKAKKQLQNLEPVKPGFKFIWFSSEIFLPNQEKLQTYLANSKLIWINVRPPLKQRMGVGHDCVTSQCLSSN